MIITLITIAILIAGIVLIFKFDVLDWRNSLGSSLLAIGVIATTVIAILFFVIQVPKQVNYENAVAKREALEYRLEHREENIVGNEMLYSEITEFNNGLRGKKRYADSPWIGWFVNDKIAEIDYIDYMQGGDR